MEEKDHENIETKLPFNNLFTEKAKMSHKKWKALLKKEKRKIKRQSEAQKRDDIIIKEQNQKEKSPSYIKKEKEKEELTKLKEERDQAEKEYLNKLWLEKERIAQEEFKRKKNWEIKEKRKREEVEKKIKDEWEERQKKEEEEKEKETEKKKHQVKTRQEYPEVLKDCSFWDDSLLKQATANENKDGDGPWHNPIASLLPGKEKETCPFFAKTGACRFGERCSRGHPLPESSTTVLMKGMYSHFELEQGLLEENDTDLILEYEEGELYNNFKDFYDDIVPEFKAAGHVVQVKICCNYEPHLRGNVYIQYDREEDAHTAMVKMNGRFYGGKQISCEPVNIKSWKSAICGLFGRGRCPKGRNCNFLHVFKNPRNEFWEYDKPFRQFPNRLSERQSERSKRYSRSPYSRRSQHRHSDSKYRSSNTYSSRSSYRSRSHRYSRSRSRSSSRSRSRSRSKSRVGSHVRHYHSKRKQSRSRSRSPAYAKSKQRYSERKQYKRSRSKETRYTRSLSRGRSRSLSTSKEDSDSHSVSKSPRRNKNKKKKHKHKKHKHSKSEKSLTETKTNGQGKGSHFDIVTIDQ